MPRSQPPLEHAPALADAIVARLDAGGATDLRAARHPVWIIGQAPSGVVFELLHWPPDAYCVTRYSWPDHLVQYFGTFPTWPDAVDYALRASRRRHDG